MEVSAEGKIPLKRQVAFKATLVVSIGWSMIFFLIMSAVQEYIAPLYDLQTEKIVEMTLAASSWTVIYGLILIAIRFMSSITQRAYDIGAGRSTLSGEDKPEVEQKEGFFEKTFGFISSQKSFPGSSTIFLPGSYKYVFYGSIVVSIPLFGEAPYSEITGLILGVCLSFVAFASRSLHLKSAFIQVIGIFIIVGSGIDNWSTIPWILFLIILCVLFLISSFLRGIFIAVALRSIKPNE